MADSVFAFLGDLPLNWIVFFASAIPLTELRAAIPFGIAGGMAPLDAWFWGVLGNLLPIPFILFMWPLIYKICDRLPFTRCILHRFVDKAREKGQTIEKQGAIGLALFVGIPLPVTGVWTGSLISFMLNLKPLKATAALTLGAMIAGAFMTLLSLSFVDLAGSFGLLTILVIALPLTVAVYVIYRVFSKRKRC
ncbi:MAG TPA: small multi-drug export protein [Clostridiales bacterium]|nr:small multi-drug export protein [Clostridiales bacterium]